MKVIGGLMVVLFVGVMVSSCFDPPEYPVVPEIEFKNLTFKDVPNPSDQDSLILEISFKDGDGDLGLDPTELGCYNVGGKDVCYNEKFIITFTSGIHKGETLNYRIKRTDPEFSSLPDYVKPYDCINWELKLDEKTGQVLDTLYIELNPDHYNIYVDFLVKQPNGTFQEFDFLTEYCTTFDGRFPILSEDVSQKNPLEGTIRYAMGSVGFLLQFSIKTLKLRVQIQDRMLNKSNTIETPEFTLQSIKR